MPYNPGVTDISGQLLAQGINGAVSGIAQNQKAIYASQDELERELAHINGTVSFARQQGILSPEDMDTYITGNMTKKRELAVKAAMGYEAMLKQQQMQMQQQGINLQERRVKLDEAMLPPELRAKTAQAQAAEKALNFDTTDPSNAGAAAMAGKVWVDGPNGPVLIDKLEPPQKPVTKEDILDSGNGVFGFPVNKAKGIYSWMRGVAGVDASGPNPNDPKTWPKITLADGTEGIGVPNGRGGVELKFPPKGSAPKPLDAGQETAVDTASARIYKIDQELKDHAAEIAKGDKRHGFFNMNSREETMAALRAEREQKARDLAKLGRNEKGMPFGAANRSAGVQTPAPTTAKAINNSLPLPESDGLPPLPPQISNAAEYNALPSKAPYIDPKGIYRIKP